MDAVNIEIMASNTLRSDFNSCVTLYKYFMVQNEGIATGDGRIISALKEEFRGGRGGRGGRCRGRFKRKLEQQPNLDGKCEDRYYSSEEYASLNKANKSYLRKLRDDRVKSRREMHVGTKKSKTDRAISVISTAVDQLPVSSATVSITEDTSILSSTALTVLPSGMGLSNPNNSALSRVSTITNSNNSALSKISTTQGHKA